MSEPKRAIEEHMASQSQPVLSPNGQTDAEPSASDMVERVVIALRDHIKVDATGLAPAVASAYVTGFEEAARAAIAAIRPALDQVATDRWTGPREAVEEVGEGYVAGFNAACASHRATIDAALPHTEDRDA